MTLLTLAAALVIQVIPMTHVAQGALSQIDEPRKVIVRTAQEFQALWHAHSTAPPPTVDFSKSIVVGVFAGMRPTAGYTVYISEVRRRGNVAVVEWGEGVPDKSQMAAQMLTSPFHLVAIPRDVEAVEFLKKG